MFRKTVADIRSLKIQGANSVAYEAVLSLKEFLHKAESLTDLKTKLNYAKRTLFGARPTEPALRNAINYVLHNSHGITLGDYRESAFKQIALAADTIKHASEQIARIGSHKIKKGMVVFTHCHSSTVVGVLKKARAEGIRFSVHNTETRPRHQGRVTAKELAKAGIPVTHYIDSAARVALKKADLMLIGADAITTEGRVINKIGSEMFAEVANNYGIPVYACTNSWKFDAETVFGFDEDIESRSPKEVWERPPKGVKIDNHAFEIVDPGLLTGIITEIGIYPSGVFVEEMRKRNPWMFKGQE